MDNRCPFGWSQFTIKRWPIDITYPILRDSAVVSSTFLHFICCELEHKHHGFNYKGMFITILMQMTLFIHPVVQSMLTAAAEEPLTGNNLFRTGRAFEIVQFGIIYGSLFVFFNPLLVFEVLWLYTYIADSLATKVSKKLRHERVFLVLRNIVKNRLCGAYVFSRTLVNAMYLTSMDQIWDLMYNFIIARNPTRIQILLYILVGNYLATSIQSLGEKFGRALVGNTLEGLQNQPQNHQFQRRYNGALYFIAWASIICTIIFV